MDARTNEYVVVVSFDTTVTKHWMRNPFT